MSMRVWSLPSLRWQNISLLLSARLLDSSLARLSWPMSSLSLPCTIALQRTMWIAHDSARTPQISRSRPTSVHFSPLLIHWHEPFVWPSPSRAPYLSSAHVHYMFGDETHNKIYFTQTHHTTPNLRLAQYCTIGKPLIDQGNLDLVSHIVPLPSPSSHHLSPLIYYLHDYTMISTVKKSPLPPV
jgi:hypothetical protein